MPAARFQTLLNHCLGLLSGCHTRVTLFAVEVPGGSPTEVEATIVEALAPLGGVGRLPDSRIGLVYLGPRGNEDGANALDAYVSERISRRLLDRGWGRYIPLVRIANVDRWTDTIREAHDLIDALPARGTGFVRFRRA